MTRTRSAGLALAEGAAVHAAMTAAALGTLVLWSRFCETRRHRSVP